jgi:hypothetical protein
MLPERVFSIGGLLCIVAGALFLGSLAWYGAFAIDPFFGVPGILFIGFGGFFVYVGAGARKERLELLRSGETGIPPAH